MNTTGYASLKTTILRQDISISLSPPPTTTILLTLLLLWITYNLTSYIYSGYIDQLSAYPGPKLWTISHIPVAYYTIRGLLPYKLIELHEKYGAVVRFSPNNLSYITEEAWPDIYGRTRPQLHKDTKIGPPPPNGVRGLAFVVDDGEHNRMRRNLSHGFTETALKAQESILMKYVDLLIYKLQKHSKEGRRPIDISEWFNLVTVDIIGDLTFGESFDCLEISTLHAWVKNIFTFLKTFALIGVTMRFPPIDKFIFWLSSKSTAVTTAEAKHRGFINQKVARRLSMNDARHDFLTHIQKNINTPTGMSISEIEETCNALILGGSETTASVLSGTIYSLCKTPSTMRLLTQEIRRSFKNESEITMERVKNLRYLNAVIEEGMRLFPPLVQQIPRVTHPQGNIIANRFVRGGTQVSISHLAAYRSAKNFFEPLSFIPDRWLSSSFTTTTTSSSSNSNPDSKNDNPSIKNPHNTKVFLPFSHGPRNCIGQNLAWTEMRLLLSKLMFHFEMALCEESKGWGEKERLRVFVVYQREALWVRLREVGRNEEGVEGVVDGDV